MSERNHLLAAALLTLLVITEAMYLCPPITAMNHELKLMAHDLLSELRTESTCTHKDLSAVHTVGCLSELKNNNSHCELVSYFDTYVAEATDLGVHELVTKKLQEINQYLQSLKAALCKSEPEVENCGVTFEDGDGDYEKMCKVMSLLKLLTRWLSRDDFTC